MAHVSLSDTSDWQLAPGAPDIRGYDAIDADGARLGRVATLVADTSLGVVSTVMLDDGTGIPAVALTVGDSTVTVGRRSTDAVAHGGLAHDENRERDSPTGRDFAGYSAPVVPRV